MLPRILEDEVMDNEADAHDYDAMDFTVVNQQFVRDLLAFWQLPEGEVLDVCTGPARIPIELCRRCPQLNVVAVDLAGHMLALAQRHIAAAGLNYRIRLQKADAKRLPFRDEEFAAVVCNGSVHHIPEPLACFRELHRVCRSGGTILVRDLVRPASETELQHLVKLHAAEANDHQRALFAASLRASLTVEEVQAAVKQLGYCSETVQRTSDRHWTWAATRWPDSCGGR
jgi:ubiquinone/menaquinone biosynthesis C-methylase UbiE